jgi:hypothetical protein
MSRVKAPTVIVSLAALHMFSLIYLIGFVAGIQFPWQPYTGKSACAVYFLIGITHLLAVIGAALIVAVPVAVLFRSHPVKFGLLVAAPAALAHTWFVWQASELVQLSVAHIAMAAKDFVVFFITPAGLAALFSSLTGHSSKRATPAA